jgi:tRNA1Val (adenine37-N6)-methyltransferase
MVPGGVEIEPGQTLDYICGHYRIFQYEKGHRYSTDDVLTAWYGTTCAPRVERAADLGSGIASVAIITAWRLPAARFCTIEAQEISIRLARKSIRYNGLTDRFTLFHGDLRDEAMLADEPPFDLVTGSPPYFPAGTARAAEHPQAIPARIETRGDVADYARTARRILAPGGVFAFVFPTAQLPRAEEALRDAGLLLLRRREVVFKEGEPSLISLFAAGRDGDYPPNRRLFVEPPLTIRSRNGTTTAEYAAVRISFGFPPGDVAAPPEPAPGL